MADACYRDSTRQISAGQRFSPTSLTCPAVRPSYRSSQLVCPGTARESPREGDHTHTCLKCKKLEELRQTDRAAKNPVLTIRHMSVRKRTHHGREGSAGAALIEKPTTTPETPTLLQSCYLDLPSTKHAPTSSSKDLQPHPRKLKPRK